MRFILAVLAAAVAFGQSLETNPFRSAKEVAEGKRLYGLYCVVCHGMDGASGRGARLASTYRRHGSTDAAMYRVIANGVPGTEMPAHLLEEDEIWKILAFVRTIERSAEGRSTGCAVTGGASRGREVFFGKGGCLTCHSATVDGRSQGAGRLGPDLTHVGATRSRAHLLESVVAPEKAVAPRYRVAKVTPRAGAPQRGMVLNQDEYTIHLIDAKEEIRSFTRAELSKVELETGSFMPSYRTSLTAGEIDDLLSFLCTLRGGRP